MKTLYNFIAIAFFLIISNAVGQDRTTYWVHGLGGSGESWDLYRPQFSLERQMNGASPTYLTTNGIPDASRQLGANIGNDPGNFIIGHSLGGLAAREYERTPGSNPVNAILTIGTPHKGAFIATNVINGNARQTITYAVEEMTAGPFAEGKSMVTNILTAFFDLPGYVASRWANKQIDRVIEEDFYAEVRSKVIEFEGGFITNSLRDLQPGSNYLNGLNSTVRPVAIANIICEENDRPGLRLGNAALFSPANYPLDQYDDTGLIRAADQLEGAYRAFRIYHDVMKFANPLRAGHHNRLANKWQRGEDYIGGKFDAEYARLIGAVRSEVRTSTYWVEECTSSCMNDVARAFECIEDQQRTNCNWVQRTSTVAVTIMEKSDGLVTDDTQRMNGVPADRIYRAVGANHLEVGNNPQVRARYNDVFNRRDEFRIEPRP